jgi:hypothetical protein
MIITRHIINKNIQFKDYYKQDNVLKYDSYTFDELSSSIDACKNFLLKNFKIEKNQSALIGVRHASRMQLSLVFALCELGIALAIVDYERDDDFIDYNYIDPKTKLLLPIHYHIVNNSEHTKFKIFEKVCDNTIILDKVIIDDYSPNNTILATKDSIVMRCTSSGTTGTPKIIEHTHQFIYELIKRNSVQFDGSAGFIFNLNHGSSPATYFFPSLASNKLTECVNFNWMILQDVLQNCNLNHLLIPYSHQIDDVLKNKTNTNNDLTLYTLSTIKRDWLSHLKQNKIKNVVSIFGSNETSGPVFLNYLNDNKFQENKFVALDNFYTIEINEQEEILVKLPIYNKVIKTNDKFKKIDDYFYHLGRSDLLRVNGKTINKEKYEYIVKSKMNADLIYDTVTNSIYLAVWESIDNLDEKVLQISKILKSLTQNAHFINKYEVLPYNNFLTGIKLDHELLRDYFRNYHK